MGRRLLDELIARARRLDGVERLFLGVMTTQTAARRLYLSRGFEIFGTRPEAIKVDGRAYDMDLMTLRLNR